MNKTSKKAKINAITNNILFTAPNLTIKSNGQSPNRELMIKGQKAIMPKPICTTHYWWNEKIATKFCAASKDVSALRRGTAGPPFGEDPHISGPVEYYVVE
jgi:hypothetical protein